MPRRPLPQIRITALASHASIGQRLQGIGLTSPEWVSALLLLERGDPEMRHGCAEHHARTEYIENDAVAEGRAFFWTGEVVICREDLDQDRAELAGGGADPMAGATVASWEDLCRDHVGCCVGA